MNYFVLINYQSLSAERAGFEPAVPFWSTHTFQACSLNHSDISPNAFQPLKPSLNRCQKYNIFSLGKQKTLIFYCMKYSIA